MLGDITSNSALNMTFLGTGAILTIDVVNATLNGGKYYCVVLNDAGFGIDSSTLYINPRFLTVPESLILTSNGTMEDLMCVAESFPLPQYQWVKYENSETLNVGSNSSLLDFNPIKFGDEGIYRCIVTSNGTTIETNDTTIHSKLPLTEHLLIYII